MARSPRRRCQPCCPDRSANSPCVLPSLRVREPPSWAIRQLYGARAIRARSRPYVGEIHLRLGDDRLSGPMASEVTPWAGLLGTWPNALDLTNRSQEFADILGPRRSGRLDRARLSPYNSLVFLIGVAV